MSERIDHTLVFPSCLFLAIDREKLSETSDLLRLTVSFGEQEIPTSLGSVRFGISRGVLQLLLKHGCLPYKTNQMTAALSEAITLEIAISEKSTRKTVADDTVSATVSATPSIGSEANTISENGNEVLVATSHKAIHAQIRAQGAETAPEFVFQLREPGRKILEGTLNDHKLGTVVWNGSEHSIQSMFSVGQKDIAITHQAPTLLGRITPMKDAIIRAVIAKSMRNPDGALYMCHGASKK